MQKVIGIQFQSSRLIYYFKFGKTSMNVGDLCVVKTTLGLDIGKVVIPEQSIHPEELETPLKNILRKATSEDFEKWNSIQADEKKATETCHEMIQKYHLDMHLIRSKYLFDRSRLIIYFYSDNRVDFRELVKELASVFKTKIELKQVGVRDKAKMVGGLGICGRPLCCTTFLSDFKPVPINVAKMQSVALNLSKVSGACGRLKCCLNYESEFYQQELKRYPKLGSCIQTKDGKEGKVIEVNILSRYIIIETIEKEDNERIKNRLKISLEEWQLDHKEISRNDQNEKNRTTAGTENRIVGKE